MGFFALVALVYCVWLARRERKIWPLMVLLGAAPMTMWESMQNIVTHVVYPEIGQHTAFEIYGRPMPIYLVLLYVCYFGVWVPMLMKKFEDGVSVKQVMKYYSVTVVFAFAFEPVPVHVLQMVDLLWRQPAAEVLRNTHLVVLRQRHGHRRDRRHLHGGAQARVDGGLAVRGLHSRQPSGVRRTSSKRRRTGVRRDR